MGDGITNYNYYPVTGVYNVDMPHNSNIMTNG